ncbi:MAG: SMP-30/gluconolactonase/LRE family protein [Longimicrobiales bacterium]
MRAHDRRTAIGLGVATLVLALAVARCAEQQEAPEDRTAAPDTALGGASADSFAIADVGFETPESVLHDPDADVYLVSNIGGDPLDRDDTGFIARLSPDGSVEQLRWIDGASETVTLHAPKGMALRGDTLYVADIDTVRAFHRVTGAPVRAIGVPGATFLNDVAAGDDGALYVTDSGLTAGFAPSGTDAVYRIDGARPTVVAEGEALSRPNGITVTDDALVIAPFADDALLRIAPDGGAPLPGDSLPAGQLDGVVELADGGFLVSSWGGGAIYRVNGGDVITTLVDGLDAPADIGFDERRGRVLIPLFNENRVEVRTLR